MPSLKAGKLAARTGLTVRTLHYYEERGLLTPERTAAGHRIYATADMVRLQQIVSLKQLGFPLEAIAAMLDDPDYALEPVLHQQLTAIDQQLAETTRLKQRLEGLLGQIQQGTALSVDDLLSTIQATTMYEKYYTPDQLAELQARADALGPDGMAKAQQDWQDLINEVRAELDQGTAADSDRMKPLVARWNALIRAFTGGNPAIAQSMKTMYEQEGPAAASQGMVDTEVIAFMQKALQAHA